MLDVMPVRSGIIAPRKEQPKRPWVLDETLPKYRNPQEVMNERMMKRELEKAKNKAPEDRNMYDYMLLANDYMKKHPSVIYIA